MRQPLNVGEAQHAGAALDGVQRAEERGDDLRIGLAGLDELFEFEQIRIDLLKQFFSLVTEIRDELFAIKEFVRHDLFYAKDREERSERSRLRDEDELSGDFFLFIEEARLDE